MANKPPAKAGYVGAILGLERSLGEGNDNPLQYSCLENPMDRGAWRVTIHGVTKSLTRLSDQTHTHLPYITVKIQAGQQKLHTFVLSELFKQRTNNAKREYLS